MILGAALRILLFEGAQARAVPLYRCRHHAEDCNRSKSHHLRMHMSCKYVNFMRGESNLSGGEFDMYCICFLARCTALFAQAMIVECRDDVDKINL
jgi:hypothetical protein